MCFLPPLNHDWSPSSPSSHFHHRIIQRNPLRPHHKLHQPKDLLYWPRLLPSITPPSPPNRLIIWPNSNFTMSSCRDVELTTAKQRPLLIPNAMRTKPTASKWTTANPPGCGTTPTWDSGWRAREYIWELLVITLSNIDIHVAADTHS